MRVAVLDMFGDLDTCRHADAVVRLPFRRGGFGARGLGAAADALCPPEQCSGVVYGSGFETRPQLVERLARGRALYGNAPEVVAWVKDPTRLFPLLDRLGIAHPEVRSVRPRNAGGWLAKRPGGAGGFHVRRLERAGRVPRDAYFQRYVAGRSCSALFLADGRRARIVGFNEQWTCGAGSFGYGGSVGRADVSRAALEAMRTAVDRLVAEFALRGLNGIDFVVSQDASLLLEINPRPTATVDLHDADFPRGLLAAHIDACKGYLTQPAAVSRPVRAHAVVYARQAWVAPERAWPAWCTDLPAPGTVIGGAEPVCTVHAVGASAQAARELCLSRLQGIERETLKEAA